MVPENHRNPSKQASLQDHILVYWPDDNEFYPGVITELTQDGKVVVHYDDGDFETLLLSDEVWKFVEKSQTPRDGSSKSRPSTSSRAASEDVVLPTQQISVHPGTRSNQHSESTVNTDNAPKIDIRGSRKRAASSSNGVNPVPRRKLMVLDKSVKGTSSGLTPLEEIPVPRKRLENIETRLAAKPPLQPKPQVASTRTIDQPMRAGPSTPYFSYSFSSKKTLSPLQPKPRVSSAHSNAQPLRAGTSASNVVKLVTNKKALLSTSTKHNPYGSTQATTTRIIATETIFAAEPPLQPKPRVAPEPSQIRYKSPLPSSSSTPLSTSHFVNPETNKKALLSKSVEFNPSSNTTTANAMTIDSLETRFSSKPPLHPKPRLAPTHTVAQRKLERPSTSNVVNILSNKKVFPNPSGKLSPSRSPPVDKISIHPTEMGFAKKPPLQPKTRAPSTRATLQPKLARPVKSNVVNPVRKENTLLTASAKDIPSSSTAADTSANPPTETDCATKPTLQPESRVVPILVTAQQIFSRPLTPGVSIAENESEPSTRFRPIQKLVGKLSQDLERSLDPLAASVKAQLNTLVPRIYSMHDMLRKTYSRATVSDEICKRLRADLENLESEVTSRAELDKVLDAAFMKQVEELKSLQIELLKQLKKDFKSFVQDEMKVIEKDLLEKVRAKSVEVFKERFREVAESTKDPAVKNAVEYMSLRTVPCKSTDKK